MTLGFLVKLIWLFVLETIPNLRVHPSLTRNILSKRQAPTRRCGWTVGSMVHWIWILGWETLRLQIGNNPGFEKWVTLRYIQVTISEYQKSVKIGKEFVFLTKYTFEAVPSLEVWCMFDGTLKNNTSCVYDIYMHIYQTRPTAAFYHFLFMDFDDCFIFDIQVQCVVCLILSLSGPGHWCVPASSVGFLKLNFAKQADWLVVDLWYCAMFFLSIRSVQ